jgi:hypothetical protein
MQHESSTSCGSPRGIVQTTPPAGETYIAPTDGVVTSFTFVGPALAVGPPGRTKLLVLESVGGLNYRVAAAGELETATGILTTRGTRVPISAGQTIGAHGYVCLTSPAGAGMTARFTGPEPPVGATQTFDTVDPGRMLLQATIEPDGDGDGFGDETQDQCPADPSLQEAPCDRVAPNATITKQPKDKTKKKKATFEFTSSEPGSTFACTLDGKEQFMPCTSPLTVKVKKGKHTFSVTAIDATGNADLTPATDGWKVKRRKKRR